MFLGILKYAVQRSDVTRNPFEWSVKTMLYKPPPPYFIVLNCQVKTLLDINLNLQSLESVSRYRDSQFRVTEN